MNNTDFLTGIVKRENKSSSVLKMAFFPIFVHTCYGIKSVFPCDFVKSCKNAIFSENIDQYCTVL